jgi:glycogen phosphorylase
MFFQIIADGFQIEQADNWLRSGNLWEIERPEYLFTVQFGGKVESFQDAKGQERKRWTDTNKVLAMPCDTMIPGYKNGHVINLRLWAARATREFDLNFFQSGNYVQAVEEKAKGENISKVLYPSESVSEGKELRLKQEYFFVSASFQDILRRFRKRYRNFRFLPDRVAIQLNDTHPSIAIPELMRILVDEEDMPWSEAWDVCVHTFSYTNHTVMPEALETWPVELMERILPRHLQIIYEINQRFLNEVRSRYPFDEDKVRRMSLIEEWPERRIRMANLSIIGSHSINGVSEVHTRIIRERLFRDFAEMFPDRFNNKTNGITQRRWLLQANPTLSRLISDKIGSGWVTDLERLRDLEAFAEEPDFQERWRAAKLANKRRLAVYIKRKNNLNVDLNSLFDVHVKRIHEYKRQLLNVLRVIADYNRLKTGKQESAPRTVIFAGKAAHDYRMAKLIIKLINSVGETLSKDASVNDRLKVLFLANYCVSSAEKIIPGAELSEQISMAGTEASGTGNMKFALNGALTIGTMDGANIEIMEEVGQENLFLFGLNATEVEQVKSSDYNPWEIYHRHEELRQVLDMIRGGFFCPEQPDLFQPIVDSLLGGGDQFLLLADFESYLRCQGRVDQTWLIPAEWTRRSILTVARMGRFSSDRTIREYAEQIWGVEALS